MKRIALALVLLFAAAPSLLATNVSANITTNTTWTLDGSPYVLMNDISVGSATGATLTIQAGVVVKGSTNALLRINNVNKGALVVNGTQALPVLFTSTNTATPVYWGGLTFETAVSPPPSTITHAVIEYAGANSVFPAGVTVAANAPAFQSVILRNNKFAGLRLTAGSASLTACQLIANTGPGINAIAGTSLTLTNTQFTGNSGYAATLPAGLVLTSASGNTATGNTGGDAIQYRGGVITSSTTWPAPGIPYAVNGTIDVMAASAPVLTIAPGNTIKFDPSSQISCNQSNKGGLQANGTAASPILFTSNGTATPGSWWGLWFGPTAAAPQSSVSYATIEYAGSNGFGRGGMAVHAGSPVFDHVTVRNNQYAGVSFTNGAPVITNSTISGNTGPGINSTGGTGLTLTNNSLTNNNGYAVTLPIGVVLASAGGNTASGNGTGRDAIEYRGGVITASRTWPVPGIPYVVTGTIDVMSASAPVLTIDPGNTIRFNSNSQISCNQSNKGGLQANGTAASPILFTSNGAAAAGSWWGLWFGPTAAAPQSSVSYATIEYAGSNGFARGGIAVHAGSPVLDHVTVRNNQYAGVSFTNGAPVITTSTITGNGGPGIYATGGTGLTLTSNNITNNTGYAVTLPVAVVLTSSSANTATGNTGGDAIQYRAGVITSNTTWPAPGIPYAVNGTIDVMAASAPVLTIAPGNIIKFDSNSQISCNQSNKGALQANGTAAAPILFTSNGTATPGSWWGLWFGPNPAPPQSSVSYATIEYAGSNGFVRGGITVNAGSPQFDHVILRNNQHSGFTATNSTPRITNTQFSGNPKGIHTNGTAAVQATLNYWDSPAGSCLPGQCTGGQQSVTTAVTWEPWLLTAPAGPQFLASATHKNPIFNPSIGTTTWLDYTTSLAGQVEVTIRNASDVLVRTLTAAGTPNTITWDGQNESGTIQPDGTYRYDVVATAPSQPPSTVARGIVVIDNTRALTLSNPSLTFAFFSPNGDAIQDTTTVSAAANYDDTLWTVSVLDGASNVVRSQEGSGPAISFLWDGRNGTAVLQPDGLYTLRVDVSIAKGPVLAKSASATLDNTLPSTVITAPVANAVLSNIHANGSTVFGVTGSATDLNLLNWSLQQGTGTAPSSWSTLASGNTSVSSALLHSWQTLNLSGPYALRLLVTDKAGNAASTITPVIAGHFKVTQSAYQFNGSIDGTINYTSTVPFPLTESVVIRNLAGAVVRNLVGPVARNAGTFIDVFNGLNDAGELLPDGPYFYTATVTAGASTFTWDLSNVMRNDPLGFNDNLGIQAYDPFNNKPLTFNYSFPLSGRVSVATTTTPGSVIGECLTPTANFFCPAVEIWQESGPQTFTWWGLDHTGSYRTIRSAAIVTFTDKFPKNAVVLFGSKPKLTNVKVTPPVFGPAAGQQAIEFDLTTFKTNPAEISIAFVNLESKSTLRTLTIAAQPPGHALIHWDGRAYNGMLVAPGRYAVVVTATDPIGNVVQSGILTTIQY